MARIKAAQDKTLWLLKPGYILAVYQHIDVDSGSTICTLFTHSQPRAWYFMNTNMVATCPQIEAGQLSAVN